MKTTLSILKADVGSIGGHTKPSQRILDAVTSDASAAVRRGLLIDTFIGHTGDDIYIVASHTNGPGNTEVHQFAWNAFLHATDIARQHGLYGAGQDMLVDAPSGNIRGAGLAVAEVEFDHDPVALLRNQGIFPAPEELVTPFAKAHFIGGDARGSHVMPLMPVPINTAVTAPEDYYKITVLLRDNERFGIDSIDPIAIIVNLIAGHLIMILRSAVHIPRPRPKIQFPDMGSAFKDLFGNHQPRLLYSLSYTGTVAHSYFHENPPGRRLIVKVLLRNPYIEWKLPHGRQAQLRKWQIGTYVTNLKTAPRFEGLDYRPRYYDFEPYTRAIVAEVDGPENLVGYFGYYPVLELPDGQDYCGDNHAVHKITGTSRADRDVLESFLSRFKHCYETEATEQDVGRILSNGAHP